MTRKTLAAVSTLLIIVGLVLSISSVAFAIPIQSASAIGGEPDLAGR